MTNAQNLPVELVFRIFRFATQSSQRDALTLSHVSCAVRDLARPYVCPAVVLSGAGTGMQPQLHDGLARHDRALCLHGSALNSTGATILPLPDASGPESREVEREAQGAGGMGTPGPYLHSLCIPARDPDLCAPHSPFVRPVLHFLRYCKLRRIRGPFASIISLLCMGTVNQIYGENLNLKCSAFCSVRKLELQTLLCLSLRQYVDWLSLGAFPCQNLTHLRVGSLTQKDVETLAENQNAAAVLPALTHLAFDLCGHRVNDEWEYEVSDEDVMRILNCQGGRTPLRVLLLFVVSEPQAEDVMAAFTITRTTDERRMSDLERSDSRIVSMVVSTDDDWHLWLRLAQENRNIWDEALRRRQDRNSSTL